MSSLEPSRRRAEGRDYWRSLDDLAQTPEFRAFVEREFPNHAEEMLAPASRRGFLKLMGASMALAGLTACRWPQEEILPFSDRPEGYVPGETTQYATAIDLYGSATGLLVTSYDGRPIKIEGNERHPTSGGSSSALMQASLLGLYDPDRSGSPRRQAQRTSWDDFDSFAGPHFAAVRQRQGEGLRILAGSSSSPSRANLQQQLLASFPRARWFEYEPVSRDNCREGARLAFGRPFRTQLSLESARSIVSLEEDLLLQHPSAVRLSRQWAHGRDPDHGQVSRLHVIESAFSLTGSVADRRLAIPGSRIATFAGCLAAALFLEHGLDLPRAARGLASSLEGFRSDALYAEHAVALAEELASHRGESVVVAGPAQPPEVHALVHVINAALGNVGRTVSYTAEPDAERPHHHEAVAELAGEMAGGGVDTLLILGGNPVYDAPADLDFAAALGRVGTTIHLGDYFDETAGECTWHVPRAHFLEAWGDARSDDGTFSVVQPLILPLRGGRSELELLDSLLSPTSSRGYDIVRRTFASSFGGANADAQWRQALHDGVVEGSEWQAESPSPTAAGWASSLAAHGSTSSSGSGNRLELRFLEDASVLDGRLANNGWMQETPDPLTKLTWDNAALLSPATASAVGVTQSDTVRVRVGEVGVTLPVHIMPGQAEGTVGVSLGYGRRSSGRVGDGVGFDVYPLRKTDGMHRVEADIEPAGGRYLLASTQDHFAIDSLGAAERADRVSHLVREVELEEYRRDPHAAMHHGHQIELTQLWRAFDYDGHRWGMSIDLNACTGCNACAVACQAENNIPVVGKEEVSYGREMAWIRVDRYFAGDVSSPSVVHQPVTCHHCENAPCEQVCPVAATLHDTEGLNVMVYNRCVGTRYCSNNCPYKVRRFNYFNNHKQLEPLHTMVYNPEVTVRSRGVMEKCSFCVQRINAVRIRSKNEKWESIPDGAVTTACEQACPTRAITFGDLNDAGSRVRRLQESDRAYTMLEEPNIRPRTRYLARVRNRGAGAGAGGHDDHGSGHGGEA